MIMAPVIVSWGSDIISVYWYLEEAGTSQSEGLVKWNTVLIPKAKFSYGKSLVWELFSFLYSLRGVVKVVLPSGGRICSAQSQWELVQNQLQSCTSVQIGCSWADPSLLLFSEVCWNKGDPLAAESRTEPRTSYSSVQAYRPAAAGYTEACCSP